MRTITHYYNVSASYIIKCVSKKAEKEVKVVEVNLDKIYPQFEELQSDFDSKIKMLKTEIAQLHTSLNEKQTTSEELRKWVDDIDKDKTAQAVVPW